MRVWTNAFTFFSFLSIIFFSTPGILYMWGWINVCSGQCIERTKGQIVQFYLISCAALCTCCVLFTEGLNRGNQSKDFPFKDLLDILKPHKLFKSHAHKMFESQIFAFYRWNSDLHDECIIVSINNMII